MPLQDFQDRILSHRNAYETPLKSPLSSVKLEGYMNGKHIVKRGLQRILRGASSKGSLTGVLAIRDRIDSIAAPPQRLIEYPIYLSKTVPGGKVKILFLVYTTDTIDVYLGGDRPDPTLIYSAPSTYYISAQLDNLGDEPNQYSAFIYCYANGGNGPGYYTAYLEGGKAPAINNTYANFPDNDPQSYYYYQAPVPTYLGNGYTMIKNTYVSNVPGGNAGGYNTTIFYDLRHSEGGTGGGSYNSGINYSSGGYSFTNNYITDLYNSGNITQYTNGYLTFYTDFTPAVGGTNNYPYSQGSQDRREAGEIAILPEYVKSYFTHHFAEILDLDTNSFEKIDESYSSIHVSKDLKFATYHRDYTFQTQQVYQILSENFFVRVDKNGVATVINTTAAFGPQNNSQPLNLIGSDGYRISQYMSGIDTADQLATVTHYDYESLTIDTISNVKVYNLKSPGAYPASISYHPGK
jgi:hypothetical protein